MGRLGEQYPFLVQFHGKVPVETAILGVVARSKVLPNPVIPGFGHHNGWWGLRLHPWLEYAGQLISLLELQTVEIWHWNSGTPEQLSFTYYVLHVKSSFTWFEQSRPQYLILETSQSAGLQTPTHNATLFNKCWYLQLRRVQTGMCGCLQCFCNRDRKLWCCTSQCLFCLNADFTVPKHLQESLCLLCKKNKNPTV